MDEQDARQIREIVRQVIEEERILRANDEFHIKRKDLYDVHQRTVGVLAMLDNISAVIGKTIVYSFLLGAAGLVIWVMGRFK